MAISPAVTVLVQDANGNTVTNDTSSVTIGSSTTGFTPGSMLTVSAVAGVATFDTIEPTTEGSGNTLTASDGSLTGATSARSLWVRIPCGLDGKWNCESEHQPHGDGLLYGWLSQSSAGTLNQTGGTITNSVV